jgi:hypothetical protein
MAGSSEDGDVAAAQGMLIWAIDSSTVFEASSNVENQV